MRKIIFLSLFIFTSIGLNLNAQWFDITPKNVNENLFGVSFIHSDTGFVVGWGSSRSLFMKTKDGGASWNVQAMQYPVRNYLFNVTASSSQEVFLSGYSFLGLCGVVMKSTNAGTSWEEFQFDDINLPYSYGIMNFLKKDDTTYFAIGYNGAIIYSENSGKKWTAADTKAPNDIFRYIVFPSHEIGYAGSGTNYSFINKLYKTTNWGDSWENIKDFSTSSVYINNLYFLTNDEGFIVGSNQGKESILKTTDGGINWYEIYSGDALNSVTSLYFEGSQNIYAINDEGKIIKSENNGDNWKVYSEKSDFQLNTSQGIFRDSNFFAYGIGAGIVKKFEIIVTVDEKSYAENSDFFIYPNPVERIAFIKIPSVHKNEKLKINITDVLGRTIFEKQEVFLDNIAINTESFPNGIFFYKISNKITLLKTGKFSK